MPTLSKQFALLDFYPNTPSSVSIAPKSVTVTVDETHSPYVTATVVVPTAAMPYSPDPRYAQFMGLRLQQDFGDLVYNYEITADYTPVTPLKLTTAFTPVSPAKLTRQYTKPWNIFEQALPISTVTTAYAPVTPLKLTNANLASVWRMSKFLHTTGTFTPAESTVFKSYLMLRKVTKDYIAGETTLELTSHEAILLDSIGYPTDLLFSFTSLRDIINYVLADTIGGTTQLQPGVDDYTYSPAYVLKWKPNQTAWELLYALVTAAGLVLFCNEEGKWYLQAAGSTSGTLALKDTDNITTLTSTIDRNSDQFFDYAVVEYRNAGSVPSYKSFGISGFPISKDFYLLQENITDPGGNPAQSLVTRGITRGLTYQVEAISNFNARPRQTMTIDITGETTKTATIQSITWSLPSARMSVDIRNLT